MQMYLVINADNLKLFEPSLLDEDSNKETRLSSVDDLWVEQEDPLSEDCILEKKVMETRRRKYDSFRISKKRQL